MRLPVTLIGCLVRNRSSAVPVVVKNRELVRVSSRKLSTTASHRSNDGPPRLDENVFGYLPSFTSTTNSFPFVAVPGWDIVHNIIVSGKCNPVIKAEFDVKPEEFSEGAEHAVETISKRLSNADYGLDVVQELMTPKCFSAVEEQLQHLMPEERAAMAVNRDDILVSWIAKALKDPDAGGDRLLFVTLSVPGLDWMFKHRELAANSFRDFTEKLQETHRHEPEIMQQQMERYRSDFLRTQGHLPNPKLIDYFVFNVEFYRKDASSPWLVSAVSTKKGFNLNLDKFSAFKWRSRMAMAVTRKHPFVQLLRWDYSSDAMIVFGIAAVLTNKIISLF